MHRMSDAMDVRPRLVDDWTETECQEAIEVEKVKAKDALVEFLSGKVYQSKYPVYGVDKNLK